MPRGSLRFHVAIHETADVADAEAFWHGVVGHQGTFMKTTIKRHNPRTNRQWMSDDYHGCLTVRVLQSRMLYQRTAGAWQGVVRGARLRRPV